MTKEVEHPLYTAAVAMMASDRLDSDSWEQIANFTVAFKGDADELTAQFVDIEDKIKADYSITAMPGRWRSAKSAALKAKLAGINLVTAEGEIKGKSAIEKEVKARLSSPSLSHARQIELVIGRLVVMPLPLKWDSFKQRENTLNMLEHFFNELRSIK